MSVSIRIGDVRAQLRLMPDDHFDCIVTSPPYWGLRDYGVAGQIGLEPTLGEHLGVMVDLFRDLRRVLKPSGTLWLNYGDCYATAPNGRSAADTKAAGGDDRTFRDKPFSTVQGRMKPKDLCMVPQRLFIALQDDGWWVRSVLPWVKRNPMPESIRDRPGNALEHMGMLTKSARYFYDRDAVMQPSSALPGDPDSQAVPGHRGFRNTGLFYSSLTQPWGLITDDDDTPIGLDVLPRGFRGAHFATFPEGLIEPLLRASCPPGGRILDPFGGSGTTAVVGERLGAETTLIELNPDYAMMAVQRIAAAHPEADIQMGAG